MCQMEVTLALKNLHTWMKDEPVTKNLVRLPAEGGVVAVPRGSSSPGPFATSDRG